MNEKCHKCECARFEGLRDRDEAIIAELRRVFDAIEHKRLDIRSWDNYGKDTFLAFDAFNFGINTALSMLGSYISHLELVVQEAKAK
jgi:hypothetical protein